MSRKKFRISVSLDNTMDIIVYADSKREAKKKAYERLSNASVLTRVIKPFTEVEEAPL